MPDELRILCADLSQRCPGFAVLRYSCGKVALERFLHLDMRGGRKCHGEMLSSIYDLLIELSADAMVFVREKGFSRFRQETQAMFKVVGIADLAAWKHGQKQYHELAPAAIKKLLTGSGKADKAAVAKAQETFVGPHSYATDDESDAAAAGIAWLISTGRLQPALIPPQSEPSVDQEVSP